MLQTHSSLNVLPSMYYFLQGTALQLSQLFLSRTDSIRVEHHKEERRVKKN